MAKLKFLKYKNTVEPVLFALTYFEHFSCISFFKLDSLKFLITIMLKNPILSHLITFLLSYIACNESKSMFLIFGTFLFSFLSMIYTKCFFQVIFLFLVSFRTKDEQNMKHVDWCWRQPLQPDNLERKGGGDF